MDIVVNVVLALATVVLGVATWRLWKTTERYTEIAGKQATIAADQAATSASVLQAMHEQRVADAQPYLQVDAIPRNRGNLWNLQLDVVVRNLGRGPALGFDIIVDCRALDPLDEEPIAWEPLSPTEAVQRALATGEATTIYYHFGDIVHTSPTGKESAYVRITTRCADVLQDHYVEQRYLAARYLSRYLLWSTESGESRAWVTQNCQAWTQTTQATLVSRSHTPAMSHRSHLQ